MSFVFFTDRDLGKQFPAILQQAGLDVERHDDHFAENTRDEEWLEVIGQQGWIAITHDSRIRYKPNELAAVVANRVALLVIVGHAPFPELAHSFVGTRIRIERFLSKHMAPFIAKVYRAAPSEISRNPNAPGRVEMWYS